MKKKLLYLTSILLFSAAVSNAQNVVRTWIFPSPSTSPFPSVGVAYTSETTINGLTLVPGASITTFGVCDGSNTNATTFTDGAIFSGRIKFGGGGIGATPALVQADYLSPTANFMPNQRYLSFPVAAGSTTVKVWFKTSTGGTPKSVICTDGISFKAFVTTVGQLNFFRWALEKDIIPYIQSNLDAIEKDMNISMREHYGSTNSSNSSDPKSELTINSTDSSRRKRTELSKSALKKVNLHQCDIVVSFG